MYFILKEADGTETIMYEDNNIIAYNMQTFFKDELGLTIVDVDPKVYTTHPGTVEANNQRADYYRNEFAECGKVPLRIVR